MAHVGKVLIETVARGDASHRVVKASVDMGGSPMSVQVQVDTDPDLSILVDELFAHILGVAAEELQKSLAADPGG